MEILKDNENDALIISDDVLVSIACNAAKDVDGVSSFSHRTADIVSTIKKGNFNVKTPVRITDDGDNLVVTMYVNFKEGTKIIPVAEKVQHVVKDAIQTMTGKVVSKVNVIAAGIDFENDKNNGEPKQTEN